MQTSQRGCGCATAKPANTFRSHSTLPAHQLANVMLSMRSAPGVAQGWVTFTDAATWQAQGAAKQRACAFSLDGRDDPGLSGLGLQLASI